MKIYVTFGRAHVHKINGQLFDRRTVAVIEAETSDAGREKAFKLFGWKFSTTHDEDEIDDYFMSFYSKGLVNVE